MATILISLTAIVLSLLTISHKRKSWRADAYPLGLFGDLPHLPEGLAAGSKIRAGGVAGEETDRRGTQQEGQALTHGSERL
jgi:hypothetical protein